MGDARARPQRPNGMSPIPPAGSARLFARATLVALLGLVVMVAAAPASQAIVELRLTQPGSDARVTQATRVRVEVDSRLLEEVEWVEARLLDEGQPVGEPARLSHQGGDRKGGTSTWATPWDPSRGWMGAGAPLRNGAYRLQARASSSGVATGGPTAWQGHEVTVSLPPSAPVLQAEPADEQSVTTTWSQANAPDFAFYRLERAREGGSFTVVTQIPQRQDTAHRDEPGSSGTWRYRLTAARRDGAGGHTTAVSEPVSVQLSGSEPTPGPTPTASPGPDSTDSTLEPDGQGDGGGDAGGGNAGDGADGESADDEGAGGEGAGGQEAGDSDQAAQGTPDQAAGEGTQAGDGAGASGSAPGFSGGREPPPEPEQNPVPELAEGQPPQPEPPQPESREPAPPQPSPQEPARQTPSDSATFSRELSYEGQEGSHPRGVASSEPTPAAPAEQGRATPGGVANPEGGDQEVAQAAGTNPAVITVGGRDVSLERVLPPVAGGLLLFVVAGHLLRLGRRFE